MIVIQNRVIPINNDNKKKRVTQRLRCLLFKKNSSLVPSRQIIFINQKLLVGCNRKIYLYVGLLALEGGVHPEFRSEIQPGTLQEPLVHPKSTIYVIFLQRHPPNYILPLSRVTHMISCLFTISLMTKTATGETPAKIMTHNGISNFICSGASRMMLNVTIV